MSKLWESLGAREILSVASRLRITAEHVRLPDGREIDDYLQISMLPFAVIVAQTADKHLVCERQYKHGPRQVILTLPAGIIEPGEDPLVAARRELLEETGYGGGEWQFLSRRVMLANAGGCVLHTFLARDCVMRAEPNSGDLEEISVELKTPEELLEAYFAGEMPMVSDSAALLPALLALRVIVPAADVCRADGISRP